MNMVLTSHNVPVETHHNNFKPTFCNLLGKCEEIQNELHSIILTLLQ